MANVWDGIAESITATIEASSKDFMDKHQDARAFVTERAQRLAKIAYDYAQTKDEAERARLEVDLKIVRLTMEGELAAVALSAKADAKSLFTKILSTAIDVFVRSLPAIVSAL